MNHHYVSQVLSRKFFNNDKTSYQYNKGTKRIKLVRSTKSLFSTQNLNSIFTEYGNIDQTSIEETLNRHFENDFNKHYNRIVEVISTGHNVGTTIPNSDELTESLQFLIGMGIIGEMRTPWHLLETYQNIFTPLLQISEHADEEFRNNLLAYHNMLSGYYTKIPLDFIEIKKRVAELMGETTYSIFLAPEGHYFILPDCTSSVKRFKLVEDDIIDGQTFINPQMAIGIVLMPLNSKIAISANASKLITTNNGTNGIYILKPEVVDSFNFNLYEVANESVVCENKDFLQKFVEGINP